MKLASGTDREIWMTPADCPEEVRNALVKILEIQLCSDSSGYLIGRWILEAPPDEQLEEAEAVAQEFRHASELRRLLLDLGEDPDPLILEAQSSIDARARKLDIFMTPISDWINMNVYKFLGDLGGALQNIAGMGSRYLPYAVWCARTFQDEGFVHFEAGRRKLAELIEEPDNRPKLQEAVEKWWPLFIDMYGSPESENDKRYMELGLKTLTNYEIRAAWIEGVLPTLLRYGIAPADPLQGKRRRYEDHAEQVAEISARAEHEDLVLAR